MGKIRARIVVEGRVQGVFFRDSTRNKAQENQVRGFVRNLRDGRVEAELEGEKAQVEKVIDFMRSGPEFAFVTRADVTYEEYKGDYKDFIISCSK